MKKSKIHDIFKDSFQDCIGGIRIPGNRKNFVARLFEDGKIKELDPRYDLVNHSPDGFNWGYSGSGCCQLSLAILAELFDDKFAVKHYHFFNAMYIAGLEQDSFVFCVECLRVRSGAFGV